VLIKGILTWLTANKSIALEAIRATAVSCVVAVDANSIRGTRIVNIARMLAKLVDARFRDTAVRIVSAFNCKLIKYCYSDRKRRVLMVNYW